MTGPDAGRFAAAVRTTQLALDLAQVQRRTLRPDGQHEDVATHSLSLALLVQALEVSLPIEWSAARLLRFATLHDAIEVLVGDVSTSTWTPELQAAKGAREREAAKALAGRIGLQLWITWMSYDAQDTPEARAVWILDKIAPKLVRLLGPADDLPLPAEIEHESARQAERLQAAAPAEWAHLSALYWDAVRALARRAATRAAAEASAAGLGRAG